MTRPPLSTRPEERLDPERVAYWYFRLNGFLQIENFIVHPSGRGGQRTDADILAVRFPFRAERLYDNPDDVMADDHQPLALSESLIDVVIVEVKTSQPCTLNGPWTRSDRQNIHRVLAAIGCLPPRRIDEAARDIYRSGSHVSDTQTRIRLVAVGRDRSQELAAKYSEVTQLQWAHMLAFIWQRLRSYRHQKKQVTQWDDEGLTIKRLADQSANSRGFVRDALLLMGVSSAEQSPTAAASLRA